jgi:hypothetical protein
MIMNSYATTSIASNSVSGPSSSHEDVSGYVDMDATQERLWHATSHDLDAIQILDPETKRKRRQISHPLTTFFNRDWITQSQYLAGMQFREDIIGAMVPARVTSTLAPFHDHGSNNESVSFNNMRQQSLSMAKASIKSPGGKVFIDWMVAAEMSDTGIMDLGRALTGMKKHAIVRKAAVDTLHECLHELSIHYKIR